MIHPESDGCPDDDDRDFPRDVPGDDDDDDDATAVDDDDSAVVTDTPPQLVVISTAPDIDAGEPIEGELLVNFTVTDPDSAEYEVAVRFSSTGMDGPFAPATLVGLPASSLSEVVE